MEESSCKARGTWKSLEPRRHRSILSSEDWASKAQAASFMLASDVSLWRSGEAWEFNIADAHRRPAPVCTLREMCLRQIGLRWHKLGAKTKELNQTATEIF